MVTFRLPQALCSLLLLTIVTFASQSFAQSVHGVFRVVKGDVAVVTKSGTTTKAKIGQKVFPSDKITAGKDSRAKIVMIDKNEINVSPDTQIVIENYQFKPEENKKSVLINVLYGKVRAKVEQKYDTDGNKFQIKTPTAVAGVRGTDFITGYDRGSKQSQVVTFHGKVEFGLPGANGAILNPVMVNPGQQTSMTGSTPPPAPVEVPKAELAGMDKSSDADKATGPNVAANVNASEGGAKNSEDKSANSGKEMTPRAPGSTTEGSGDLLPPPPPPPPPPPLLPPTGSVTVPPKPPEAPADAIRNVNRILNIKVSPGGI